MSALKLHQEMAPFPRRFPEWVAPASRVFLGFCLLACGMMAWQGGHDVLLAASFGRSFEEARRESESARAELNRRVTALILKLDRLPHDPD